MPGPPNQKKDNAKVRVAVKSCIPPQQKKWIPVKLSEDLESFNDKVVLPQLVHGLAPYCEAQQFTFSLAKDVQSFHQGPALLVKNSTLLPFQVNRGQRIATLLRLGEDVELRQPDPEEDAGLQEEQ